MSGKIEFVQGYKDVNGKLHEHWYQADIVNRKYERIRKLYEWAEGLPLMPRKEEVAEHIEFRWEELKAIMADC